MEIDELIGIIEAVLFVSGEAVALSDLAKGLESTELELTHALATMQQRYDEQRRGIRLQYIGPKVQLATRGEYSEYIEVILFPSPKQTLSQSLMETLAAVAYCQPVTRMEVEAIRGVKCDYAISVLVGKRLITDVGRKDAVGRPVLYGTTEDFLRHFGLESLEQLPARQRFMDISHDATVV